MANHALEPVVVAEGQQAGCGLHLQASAPGAAHAEHALGDLGQIDRVRSIDRRLAGAKLQHQLVHAADHMVDVDSMSRWKSGLAWWRSAFFSISDSCATRFFRSCTTNATCG